MDKLFKIKFNIKKTIVFSIVVGIFCGIFGGLPILSDSSFTDMAGGYEFWTFTAVIICVGSKNFYMAGLNCGLYFLITQPLQFYIQAFLYSHDYNLAFYYFKLWLPVIALTFIGGAIAYFSKKQNWIGATILGIGNAIEMVSAVSYCVAFLNNPPYHLLAFLFSVASIFVMTFSLQKKKKNRLICFGVPIALCILALIYIKMNGLSII